MTFGFRKTQVECRGKVSLCISVFMSTSESVVIARSSQLAADTRGCSGLRSYIAGSRARCSFKRHSQSPIHKHHLKQDRQLCKLQNWKCAGRRLAEIGGRLPTATQLHQSFIKILTKHLASSKKVNFVFQQKSSTIPMMNRSPQLGNWQHYWLSGSLVNRNPADVDPRKTQEGRAKLMRTNADRIAGFATVVIKVIDQKRPYIDLRPTSCVMECPSKGLQSCGVLTSSAAPAATPTAVYAAPCNKRDNANFVAACYRPWPT